ncbi:MAG: hypothetical protein DI598_11380 [Pseudopedobacter saltans]|uniref:Pilus formation protein N-terminal domain-containing protein n=1 Tax=Pseudopedobacter saltans TaxID=151895 RepID=A0A2W5GYX9_9SPHI|nr:MAG: hypothetical protein DI598_11380 [Pseudopedobacter saltans]
MYCTKCRELSVLMLVLFACIFSSCKKEYEQANDLVLELNEVSLSTDSTVVVSVVNGNGSYEAVSSNVDVVTATVNQNAIVIKAGTNVNNAEAVIAITDRYYQRANIHVRVTKNVALVLSKDSIVLNAQQGSDTFSVKSGAGNYKVSISNSLIAKTIVQDSVIRIVGKQAGQTTLTVSDQLGKTKTIPIRITGADYAFAFGTSYFGWADFKSIAQVDPTIRQNKQITFELTCKISGYRGLQTFLGLENNLIIRGKNDDYKSTHPIEIAGLHDSIMLLSTSNFNLNEWMNIALVVDCDKQNVSDKYKLYINGIADPLIVQQNKGTHTTVDLSSSGDNNLFEIGRASGQDFRAMQGTVSEARVWTVARTAMQIKDNMCSLTESAPVGLLARWKFSAGVNTNYIQDVSGGKYETNLILSAVSGGGYGQVFAPSNLFVERGCPK